MTGRSKYVLNTYVPHVYAHCATIHIATRPTTLTCAWVEERRGSRAVVQAKQLRAEALSQWATVSPRRKQGTIGSFWHNSITPKSQVRFRQKWYSAVWSGACKLFFFLKVRAWKLGNWNSLPFWQVWFNMLIVVYLYSKKIFLKNLKIAFSTTCFQWKQAFQIKCYALWSIFSMNLVVICI